MSRVKENATGHQLLNKAIKGRGAVSNSVGRFEQHQREAFDDGWDSLEALHDDALGVEQKIATSLMPDNSMKLINYVKSPDIPFDRSINPYRGCEHGCIYCFARPSHSYWGLSAGLDFETRLFYKPDAVALLEKELSHPKYTPAPIAFGTNTDPYQPIETEKKLTRGLISKLVECRHPFTIVTKSSLILRDLDILADAAKHNLVRVLISVTTLDHLLANKLEPRATTPKKRLEAIQRLTAAGIPTGSLVAPIMPALNDHEIEDILTQVKDAGADSAGYILLRLPLEVNALFEEWLEVHYPNKRKHVLSLVEQCREGNRYQNDFGKRMVGTGPYAELIRKRFALARKKIFLNNADPDKRVDLHKQLDCTKFNPPTPKGGQFSLL